MLRLGAHLTGCVHKCIGLGLQCPAQGLSQILGRKYNGAIDRKG